MKTKTKKQRCDPRITETYRGYNAPGWELSATGRASWVKKIVNKYIPQVQRLANLVGNRERGQCTLSPKMETPNMKTALSVTSGTEQVWHEVIAEEGITAEPTFRVFVNAPGWRGSFALPQSCFNELTSFLARHACAEPETNRERD